LVLVYGVRINTLGALDTNQFMSEAIVATLLSYIKVKAGQETAYEDMQAVLYQDTWANEPGCRRWVKWVDPMDRGSKGLVPSNPQEPQADASPLMIENSQTMPIEVPDWWREQRS
jgi:hypothetical protein